MRFSILRRSHRVLASAIACIALNLVFTNAYAARYTFRTLYSFIPYGNDGAQPQAELLAASDRLLYGTTSGGGSNGGGTVFKMSSKDGGQSWQEEVIYNFCARTGCVDGRNPAAPLIVDNAGNLYGTAELGGAATDKGVVFKLKRGANGRQWSLQVLYNFCLKYSTCPDGHHPTTGLSYQGQQTGAPYDGVSSLYGVTQNGGPANLGTAFSLTPQSDGTWKHSIIHTFCKLANCADDGPPTGELTVDADGNLIGAAGGGVYSGGMIYKLSPPGSGVAWNMTTVYSFCQLADCADGESPLGPLTFDTSGNLVGTTANGGAYSSVSPGGTVFSLAQSGSETVLHSFCAQLNNRGNCVDGESPYSGIVINPDGTLFGTAESPWLRGGNTGMIFRIRNGTFSKLYKFCSTQSCTYPLSPSGLTRIPHGFVGTTRYGGTGGVGTVFELTQP